MKNLFKALAAFQQECPTIHKATTGYGYTYADLPAILEVVNPLLKKHGLGFTQPITDCGVHTTLFHIESGETIESCTPIPKGVELKGQNQFQVLGSAITYIRRYALSSILGIVTDKDTDASGEQEKKPKQPESATKETIFKLLGTSTLTSEERAKIADRMATENWDTAKFAKCAEHLRSKQK